MKKLLLIPALAAVAYAALHRPEKPKQLLLDRVWMDHLPRSERDPINLFLAFDTDSIGNYVTASRWQGKFELFRFDADGDQLRVVFPQNGDKETLAVRAEPCHERGFDFCLTVSGGSRGVAHYFSRKGWEIEPHGDVQAVIASVFE